jgi:hypothetical protein
MKKLIDIGNTFFSSDNKLVLGGANSALDNLTKTEISDLINKKVILKRPGFHDIILNVLEVEITYSIIDQKNIFILVNDDLSPKDIINGSELYLYTET